MIEEETKPKAICPLKFFKGRGIINSYILFPINPKMQIYNSKNAIKQQHYAVELIWALSQENLILLYANNNDEDQPIIALYFEFVCLFDLILYVHSTILQLCRTGLPGLNQY